MLPGSVCANASGSSTAHNTAARMLRRVNRFIGVGRSVLLRLAGKWAVRRFRAPQYKKLVSAECDAWHCLRVARTRQTWNGQPAEAYGQLTGRKCHFTVQI